MTRFAAMLFAFALVACDQAGAPQSEEAPSAPAPAEAAPAAAAPLDPSQVTAADAINACYLTAAQVADAMGGSFSDGVAQQTIIPQRRSCAYDSRETQVRVNVTWIEPTQVEAWRAALERPLAGQRALIEGDPDGAIFQMQADIGTCAIFFVRGNLEYELRLMTCRGAPDAERAKLLRLPRPA